MRKLLYLTIVVALVALAGFGIFRLSSPRLSQAPVAKPAAPPSTPLQVVLTPLGGTAKIDRDIAGFQNRIKTTPDQAPALLERLGWSFVEKARISSDPGYYKLAEQCAAAIVQMKPDSLDGELLRGHILHALHRFKEAEALARKLVAQRTFTFDYALLGDALMEQGQLDEAVDAYQKMVDLKPCLQTYSRVAHMRWLKGDLPGAIQAIRFAVSGGSILEPEPVAWAYTKLASYELQAGHYELALKATTLATRYVPDYAAAQLVRGRILLAQDKAAEAVDVLRPAAEKSPLPEYLWILADALRASGKPEEAVPIEKKLQATGIANDPRTFALFLATRGEKLDVALRLAKEELTNRQDIFTRDALAWTKLAHGDIAAAEADMQKALAEGTKDGRLFYHAGVIAAAAGNTTKAQTFLNQAKDLEQTLMPSERSGLENKLALLPHPTTQVSSR
ncbi:MAG: tetratricopeptide repeat protein [Verrucomicrobiota bacterium]|nr:tetratricopeptide repeat protein [Verrucomicrobiota bacterium]